VVEPDKLPLFMERFQKLALAALISVLLLLFVGAIVRATGSGLGCPDWPTCWGSLVPPTKVEQIDFEKIDLAKFRRKAIRHGRDPSTITRESLRDEFNPVHTWVEYVNRLCSLPVGFLTLALCIVAFRLRRRWPSAWWGSLAGLILVLVNADLGRRVVISGLKPGIITLHMALAILLVCVLVFVLWRGCATPWRRPSVGPRAQLLWYVGLGVFVLTVAEGVMGAQVRELTDEFAKTYGSESRSGWSAKLEGSMVYLVHRSFSWLIVIGAIVMLGLSRKTIKGGLAWPEKSIGILVGAMLCMGVILSQVGVLPVVQVLHVGAAAFLVTVLFFWLLATRPVST
jgi:cytochrome c oxidase assembly protein subunit 15